MNPNHYSAFPQLQQQQQQQNGSSGQRPGVSLLDSLMQQFFRHPIHSHRYDTCPVCMEENCRLELFCCSHGVCTECRRRLSGPFSATRCPMCRADISTCLLQPSISAPPPALSGKPLNRNRSAEDIIRELQILHETLVVEIRLLRQAIQKSNADSGGS